jgi:Pyruvate/2-oxoacid:ferredoxin oxidoreductase delta subunit
MFARLLVRLYESLRPDVTIVDGIIALEGQGPGKGGNPRELNCLIGGNNAHSVDKTVCTLLGVNPQSLATIEQAQLLGVFDGEAHVTGHMKIIYDFELPDLGPLTFGAGSMSRLARRHLIQKPIPNNRRCKLCGECWKICPAKVISYNDRGIRIDYLNCIRCYCCVEVCPHGAILAKEPLIGQVVRKLTPLG